MNMNCECGELACCIMHVSWFRSTRACPTKTQAHKWRGVVFQCGVVQYAVNDRSHLNFNALDVRHVRSRTLARAPARFFKTMHHKFTTHQACAVCVCVCVLCAQYAIVCMRPRVRTTGWQELSAHVSLTHREIQFHVGPRAYQLSRYHTQHT